MVFEKWVVLLQMADTKNKDVIVTDSKAIAYAHVCIVN